MAVGTAIVMGVGAGLSALGAGLKGKRDREIHEEQMLRENELEEQRKKEAERSGNLSALTFLQNQRQNALGSSRTRLGFRDALAQSIFKGMV